MLAQEKGLKIAVAESFTGGLIADALVKISGSSTVFLGGVIVNTHAAKTALLGIPAEEIAGARVYTEETAKLMAEAVLLKTGADFAVASTGVADGESYGIGAGTCFLALAIKNRSPQTRALQLKGMRNEIRQRGAKRALKMLLGVLKETA